MLYYMNSDTGKVIAREIGDEPFGDLWFEIGKEEYEEAMHPLSPANTGLQADGAKRPAEMIECGNCGVPRFVHGGILEACPNCGDDETDLAIWDDVP